MATEIIVPSSLGNEFNFQLPSSLPAARTYEIRVAPINSQSFNKAGAVIQFDLPCNKRGQYFDPTTSYVRFKVVFSGGTAGTDKSMLLGTGYSFFSRQEVYGNNSVILETINEYGILANLLINTQLNASDKVGMAPAFGTPDSHLNAMSNGGHLIFDTATATTFEYALPVIGILGSGTDKMIPTGAFASLRFELTLDSVEYFTALTAGTVSLTGYTISDVEFVAQVIELDDNSQSLIEAQNPNKIHIRTQSYRTSTNTIPGGSSGLIDLLIGARCSSLKSMYISCSPANAAEGKYASVCANLTQGTCMVLAGLQIPQRSINAVNRPPDAFMELQRALGALSCTVYNGCVNKTSYYTSSTTTGTTIYTSPSQFYMGFNTEIIAHRGGLLSGININTAPSFFRCQISTALSASIHTFYFFAFHDVILEIDPLQKTIVAKF
jgi:hypothetical protein